jgi:hypothetical protein
MKKVNDSVNTLKTLSIVYGWMALASCIFLVLTESDPSWIGGCIRFIITLAFLYGKNNWRVFILASAVFAFAVTLFGEDFNGLSLLDLAGNAIIFWYALKYRK